MVTDTMAGRSRTRPPATNPSAARYVFPRKLRELRKQRGWSQSEVAKRIGVERSLIGNYEQELNQPTIGTALKLADLFEVSLDALVLDDIPAGTKVHDPVLHEFFLKVDLLPYETKAMIKSFIEGILAKLELERLRQQGVIDGTKPNR